MSQEVKTTMIRPKIDGEEAILVFNSPFEEGKLCLKFFDQANKDGVVIALPESSVHDLKICLEEFLTVTRKEELNETV